MSSDYHHWSTIEAALAVDTVIFSLVSHGDIACARMTVLSYGATSSADCSKARSALLFAGCSFQIILDPDQPPNRTIHIFTAGAQAFRPTMAAPSPIESRARPCAAAQLSSTSALSVLLECKIFHSVFCTTSVAQSSSFCIY